MILRLLYIFLGTLIALSAFAQEDTDFWFVAPDVSRSHGDRPIHMVITSLAFETYVQISMPANDEFQTIGINLPPNTTRVVDLSRQINEVENAIHTSTQTFDPFSNKGMRIRSTAPIKAYYEVSSPNNPDMFSLKGKNALGTHFFTIFQQERNNALNRNDQAYSGFHLVATEDNTVININPTAHLIGKDGDYYPKGVPFTITLNRAETFVGVPARFESGYIVISQEGPDHPSGTEVTSSKPIAMTLHDCSVDGIVHTGAKDLRGDQHIPVNMLGKEYIVMQGQGRVSANGLLRDEQAHILAVADNEKIYINGQYVATLNKGQKYILQVSQPYMHIRSEDSVVYVMQISGEGSELGKAILPTTSNCTGSFEVAFTRTGEGSIFLNIMVIKGAEGNFLFNGAPVHWLDASLFQPVPGDDRWVALKTTDLRDYIVEGQNSVITNTKDLFHLGLINTNRLGTKFGYFSNFNEFTTNVINTNNGQSYLHACHGKPVTFLSTSGMSEYNSDGLKYLWSTGDTTASIQVIPSTDSSFYVTVTLDNACNMTAVDSGSMTVSDPIFPFASPADTLVCIYDSVILQAGGSEYYFWSNGAVGDSILVLPDTTTMFYVSVTDAGGCYELDSVFVEVYPIPDLVLPDLIQACEGESVHLDTELDPSYYMEWENGDTSKTRTVTETALYSIKILGEGDCWVPDTVEAIFYAYPTITVPNDTIICRNRMLALQASGGMTYRWSHNNVPFSTIYVQPTQSTTYYVSAYNYVCESKDSVRVDVHKAPELISSTGSNVACQGELLALSLSHGLEFLWFNGDTTETIHLYPEPNRSYGVMVLDSNNCQHYLFDRFSLQEAPTLSLNGKVESVCPGDTTQLVADYVEGYEYRWNNGWDKHQLESADTGRYFVTVTNTYNCKSKDSAYITWHPIPKADAGEDRYVCKGDTVLVSAATNPFYTYEWSSDHNTPAFQVVASQDTSFQLVVRNQYLCVDKDTLHVSVEEGPPPGVIDGSDTVYNDNDFSIYSFAETPGNLYTWHLADADSTSFSSGQTGSAVVVDWTTVSSSVYRLSLIEKEPLASCSTQHSLDVFVAALPSISIQPYPISCYNAQDGRVVVRVEEGIPPFTYSWSTFHEVTSPSREQTLSGLDEGAYTLTVYDTYGKQVETYTSIANPQPLRITSIAKQDVRCHGAADGAVEIFVTGGTPGYDFYWSHTMNLAAYQPGLSAGNYAVSVYDKNDCTADTALTIQEPEPMIVHYTAHHPYCQRSGEGRIQLHVEGGVPFNQESEPFYLYSWSEPSTADSLVNLDPGVYYYTVTDQVGCIKRDTVLLTSDLEICVDVPTAFTPNGDGVNDRWEIPFIDEYYPNAQMEVFDRYGRLVYLSTGGYTPWDGRKKGGKLVPIDSYYYVLNFVDAPGYQTGIITIIY